MSLHFWLDTSASAGRKNPLVEVYWTRNMSYAFSLNDFPLSASLLGSPATCGGTLMLGKVTVTHNSSTQSLCCYIVMLYINLFVSIVIFQLNIAFEMELVTSERDLFLFIMAVYCSSPIRSAFLLIYYFLYFLMR